VRLGWPRRRVAGPPPGSAFRARRPSRRRDAAHPIRVRDPRRGRFRGRLALTPSRAAGLLGLLASVGAIYGLAGTPAFTLGRTDLPELRWTTEAAIVAAVGTADGTNLFSLATGPIETRLRLLPGVADADVSVGLPDTLVVRIREREAILAWAVEDSRFLVDRDGVLFARSTTAPAAIAGLPTIADARETASTLIVGSVLDPLDLDAATRLGSLVPADLGSSATALAVTLTTANGYVVGTVPRSWYAVFGLYTPSLRTPAMIPGQVRLLRSLINGREADIERVFLPDEDSGTFVLKATQSP